MADLSKAVVGTKLKVPEQYGRSFHIRTVTGVTAAKVTCGDTRFRKRDGLLLGSGSNERHRTFASVANEGDIIQNRIACAKSRLPLIKVTAENLSVVEHLIAESEAAAKHG